MTNDEALKLKPGDRVEAKINGKWRVAVVQDVLAVTPEWMVSFRGSRLCRRHNLKLGDLWRVSVRQVGRTAGNKRHPTLDKHADCLRLYGTNYTPHVYADWLWENGYPEAADALRRAFPLVED